MIKRNRSSVLNDFTYNPLYIYMLYTPIETRGKRFVKIYLCSITVIWNTMNKPIDLTYF